MEVGVHITTRDKRSMRKDEEESGQPEVWNWVSTIELWLLVALRLVPELQNEPRPAVPYNAAMAVKRQNEVEIQRLYQSRGINRTASRSLQVGCTATYQVNGNASLRREDAG